MTTHLSAESLSVAVPGAPAIPGLAFRRGRPGEDWPLIVELVNRARAADGIDQVMTADAFRAEYELDVLVRDRPRPPRRRARRRARRDLARLPDGARLGPRAGGLGRRSPRAPAPGHRHRDAPRHARPARGRGGDRPSPGTASLPGLGARGRALRRRAPGRRGVHRGPVRVRDAPVHHGLPAAAPAAGRPRAAAGHAGRAPGDLRRRQRGVPRPLGLPRDGRRRLPRAVRQPGDRHVAVVRRLGRRRGRGRRDERDLRRGERAARHAPGLARARVRAPGMARARRRQGPVRGVVLGPPRPGHGRGLAGCRRLQPDGRPPAVRAPRLPRRASLAGVRPAARRAGSRGLAARGRRSRPDTRGTRRSARHTCAERPAGWRIAACDG